MKLHSTCARVRVANHNRSCNCRKNAAVEHALVVEHHGAYEARVRETQTRVGASTMHLRVCSLVGVL